MYFAITHISILCRPGEYNLSFPVLTVQISTRGRVELPENGTVLLKFDIPKVNILYNQYLVIMHMCL